MAQIMPPRRKDMSASLYDRIKPFYFDEIKAQGKHPKAIETRKELVSIHKERLKYYRGLPMDQKLLDIELLASQLSDRDAQAGESVILRDGNYKIIKVFAAGGGYTILLRPTRGRSKRIPKLVCRGTAASLRAQEGLNSIRNDFTPQIARLAVITNFSAILVYLKSKNITRIDILGKSMGGAIAQQLAVLFEYASDVKVKSVTTLCSTGVRTEVNDFFKRRVLSRTSSKMTITVLRTGGSIRYRHEPDYVPLIGGVHLGHGTRTSKCRIKIVYLGAESGRITRPSGIRLRGYNLARAFIGSFGGGHGRQTTLLDFGYDIIDSKDRDRHLAMGERMESWRRTIVAVLHVLPWEAALDEPFADFADRMKNEGRKRISSSRRRSRRGR